MGRFYLLLILCMSVQAQDWPQFAGPSANNKVASAKGFSADLSQWSQVWEINVGVGYSAVAIDGKEAFTMGHDGKDTETIYCLDASSGRLKWRFDYKGPLINKLHKGGPNATPTVEGEFVYIMGKAGQAFCLNKSDGSIVWQRDLLKIMQIKQPAFGLASSPVIHGNMVLYASGKTVALDKLSGKTIWASQPKETEEASYHPGHATSVVFSHNGAEYVTFYVGTGLEILSLKDGSPLARYNVSAKYNMTASTPIVIDGNKIFLAWSNYSVLLEFDGKSLKQLWKTRVINQSMQNAIYHEGVFYGTSGRHGSKRNTIAAIEAKTGKTLWEQKGFAWAQITAVGDTLVCQEIKGDLVTVKMNAEKFEQVSRREAGNTTCWTQATYGGGLVYTRNNDGRVVCYSPMK